MKAPGIIARACVRLPVLWVDRAGSGMTGVKKMPALRPRREKTDPLVRLIPERTAADRSNEGSIE